MSRERALRQLLAGSCIVSFFCAPSAGAWTHYLDGSAKQSGDFAVAVVVDTTGDAFVGGTFANKETSSDLAVLKFDGASGNTEWRREIDGGGADWLTDLALAGPDVVAVGQLGTPMHLRSDIVVLKFDGNTGEELWRQELTDGLARSVAVDSAGDVVVVGRLRDASDWDFFVAKYHGDTGSELWRFLVEGGGLEHEALSVAVSPGGNVVASGAVTDGNNQDFFVVAIDGVTGAELWRQQLRDEEPREYASVLRLDPNADVLAIGRISTSTAFVLKFDGATGNELWRTHVGLSVPGPNVVRDIAVDPSGTIWAAGSFGPHFGVAKLDGETGTEVWAKEIAAGEPGLADHIHLDPAGNPIVVGAMSQAGAGWPSIIKLDQTTGSELWRQQLLRPHPTFGNTTTLDTAVDPHGNPILVGRSRKAGFTSLFTAVKLDGVTGSTCGLEAKHMSFKDPSPEKRRIQFLINDTLVMTGWGGSSSDPRVSGATLTLHNPTTQETATIPLPAKDWTWIGNPPGAKGYRFRAPPGENPCRITIKPSKLVRGVCSSKRGPLPFTLDEPSQGSIVVAYQAGPTAPLCAKFGGSVSIDVPGFFKARKVPRGGLVCP